MLKIIFSSGFIFSLLFSSFLLFKPIRLNSSKISSTEVTILAPLFIKLLAPMEFFENTEPGMAKTSRFCSSASRAVIRAPDFSGASTTNAPRESPETIRLRSGKYQISDLACGSYSLITAPPESTIFLTNAKFSFGNIDTSSMPDPKTAMVLQLLASAPKWAWVSMPSAKPLTILKPNSDNSLAILNANVFPYSDAALVPTIAKFFSWFFYNFDFFARHNLKNIHNIYHFDKFNRFCYGVGNVS